jgi:hypothetical protein
MCCVRLAGCCVGAGLDLGSAFEARCPLDVSWEPWNSGNNFVTCSLLVSNAKELSYATPRCCLGGTRVSLEAIEVTSSVWMCSLLPSFQGSQSAQSLPLNANAFNTVMIYRSHQRLVGEDSVAIGSLKSGMRHFALFGR